MNLERLERRKRAHRYFASYGINPNTKGNTHQDRLLDFAPVPVWDKKSTGVISYQCNISVESFLFYTHIEVEFVDPNTQQTYQFEGGSTANVDCVFDTSNNKIVILFQDNGDSGRGKGIVGTVDSSDNSISFGSPTQFNSGANNAYSISAAFDSSNNKVVVAYRDGGNSNFGTAAVGTVSGTSISFGTPVVYESANSQQTAVVFDSSNNKVVIGYKDGGNSDHGTAIVGTVSGTSISFGSAAVFNAG